MKKNLKKLNIFFFIVFLCNLGYAHGQYVEENKFRIAPIILSAQEQFEYIKASYAASDTTDLKRVVDNLRPQPGSLTTNGMPVLWLYDIHVYKTGEIPYLNSGVSIGVPFSCPVADSGARVQETHPNIQYDANGNLSNIDHVCELIYNKEINPRDYICEANNPNLFTPNPVFLPTGEKMLLEVDYIDRNPSPLNIIRSYRSRPLYGKSTTFNFGPKLLSIGNSAEIADILEWIQWNPSFRPETSQYDNFTESQSALVEHNGDYFVFQTHPQVLECIRPPALTWLRLI